MKRLTGSSLVIAALLLILLGWIITWDLVAWLINATGILLIILGVVLGIIGLVQVLSGSRRRSRSRF